MEVARLEKFYQDVGRNKIKKKFNITNNHCIPKLEKVVISAMAKESISDLKVIEHVYNDIFVISGQKPIITKAKKSIASFKLREGMKIGVKVTLRRRIMYEFIDRLINIALPRSRDFRGLSTKQFDKNGNYSLGIKEQIIFPEVNYNTIDKVRGMGVVVVTSTNNDEQAKFLLEVFNFPFIN